MVRTIAAIAGVPAMPLALALAGCTTMPTTGTTATTNGPGAPVAIESEVIRYETSPCYGTCPVYVVAVRPDGSGVFTGIAHTAVTGERSFRFDPAAYRRFAAAMAPYRPEGEALYQPGTPLCGAAATDMSGVDVRWSEITGGGAHLSLYYGCDRAATGAMREALIAAPGLLPIAAFIGRR